MTEIVADTSVTFNDSGLMEPFTSEHRRPEFAEFWTGCIEIARSQERLQEFDLVSSAIHSYGAIREWDAAARFNLVVDIIGMLGYAKPTVGSDEKTLQVNS